MTATIIGAICALIPFLIWLWKRKAANDDDKFKQHEKRIQEAKQAVASGDSVAVNARLDESLRWLQSHDSAPSGQGDDKAGSK